MALSKLSGDVQGIILGQLCNPLEPRLAVYCSSASKELRLLLTPAMRQKLRTDHEAAAALCRKVGMRSCKELREAVLVSWSVKGLSTPYLATLGTLGSVMPALRHLNLNENCYDPYDASIPDVQPLVAGLNAGALPAATRLNLFGMHVGDAGALELGAALGRGALPRLKSLALANAAIGDAELVALAPALRRLPALEHLSLIGNPLGDEGLAALVAPPPPAGAPPPPAGGQTKFKQLFLCYTEVTDAGCAALAAALDSGALPALELLDLDGIPASATAIATVYEARASLYDGESAWEDEESGSEEEEESEEDEDEDEQGEDEGGEEDGEGI